MPDVILPVLDEAEAIPDVLAAMPAGYHPIVVDNGSTDRSGEIAAECGAEVVTESAYRPLGTDGYDVVGSYGSSTIRDCRNWCRQVERAVRDTITVPERIRRYFTQWG